MACAHQRALPRTSGCSPSVVSLQWSARMRIKGRRAPSHVARSQKRRQYSQLHTSRTLSSSSSSSATTHQTNNSRHAESEQYTEQMEKFVELAKEHNLIPIHRKIFSDQLTPVLAYRCLVQEDDREAPSFLLESVTEGTNAGRYSFVGAQPRAEIVATGHAVTILDHESKTRTKAHYKDPMDAPEDYVSKWKIARTNDLPDAFTGGWVGYVGYDTVRYVESKKLPFESAPEDDLGLPDIHLGMYQDCIIFDAASKVVYVVHWKSIESETSAEEAYREGQEHLERLISRISPRSSPELEMGTVDLEVSQFNPRFTSSSNMTPEAFKAAVASCKEHIAAGDIFQVVLSQRFERRTFADPFEIYRALRIVNPSPYMIYIQARGSILVASSPEILCKVKDGQVWNRPLAGTRRRGKTQSEDLELAEELLNDPKEIAEHIMLVDLGRNDVGKVSKAGSVELDSFREIERYSHVMHISSTVIGQLKDDLTAWDALRSTLPVGTISGAPKVRAMEIIDEMETKKRGPYGGGIGFISFSGELDIALALRTMVIPTSSDDFLYSYDASKNGAPGPAKREWCVYLQAGAGIVADSSPEKEYEETVNKAAALGRAIDLAEVAFLKDA